MTARELASLTAADIDRSITHGKVRGSIKSIRHFRVESGTATAHGLYTSVTVKVPAKPGAADHREIWEPTDTTVEVS